MTRSYTHSRPYPAWNRVQLEVGVASGAALVNCGRTITALLECGDLSPLWPGRQNESGDKSPHSISDSLFALSFARILHRVTPARFAGWSGHVTLPVILS